MILGHPARFALEATIRQVEPPNILGHLCLWAADRCIGEYGQMIILQTPAIFIRDFLGYKGPRNHVTLQGKTNEEILEVFHHALSSDGELSLRELALIEYRQHSDIYKMCEVCPRLSPSFDGDEAVLLEYVDRARFIWRAFEEVNTHEIDLALGECQLVLNSFVEWVQTEELRNGI